MLGLGHVFSRRRCINVNTLLRRQCKFGSIRLSSTAPVSIPVAPPSVNRVTPRATSFSRWYADVISAADLVDAETPVKGCAILRPRGFALWAGIQRDLDARINSLGAQGVYFPLLVPVSFLSREATHIAGFASEVAVVTHSRLAADPSGVLGPDPRAKLSEPLVVRPTSEALVWDAFSRWVRSSRDLPLVINQWANVVRWERRTRPFLRTTEFLWQEGHTAHADEDGARTFADAAVATYAAHARDALALAPVLGEKSASERFAGARRTRTAEAILANGWALQAATVHELGTEFSSAFGVSYLRPNGERALPWGTSWGASTRLVGAVALTHSDDTGLVLPPAIAPEQIVIIALAGNKSKGSGGAAEVIEAARRLAVSLRSLSSPLGSSLRVAVDDDVSASPGGRFYEWERRGVPLRLELGPRELASGMISVSDRVGALRGSRGRALGLPAADSRGRLSLSITDVPELAASLRKALDAVHAELLARAEILRDDTIIEDATYPQFLASARATSGGSSQSGADVDDSGGDGVIGDGARASAFLLPWTDDAAAEARLRAETRYTLRCFPDDAQSRLRENHVCFMTGRPATHMALFARAF